MKKWLLIVWTVLTASSCALSWEPELPDEPEGRVELTFSLAGEGPATKALGEAPQLETVHLAVFGGSGYLKEYVKADYVSEGTYTYEFEDSDGKPTQKEVPAYTYRVSLALSNSSRRVHIIGNGPESIPFGRDYEVLPSLLVEKEKTGFWQMIALDHVTAKQDDDGDYIYNGHKRQSGEPYEPSDKLQEAFTNIPLIRNWAKIELRAANLDVSHFTPYSFAVVNAPSQGTLVPYGGSKGFITNYKDLSFDELRSSEYNYGGNLPTSVEFDRSVPPADHFVHPENSEGRVKTYSAEEPHLEEHTVYLFERPVPDANMEPTYVIVYGRYFDPLDTSTLTDEERANGGVDCYYKVDLMEGSEYYPVLRNFKYEIQIDKISARGHNTPEAAAAAAGSADVSADVNASALPDISDGTRRMAIQDWMAKTFIHAEPKKEQLYVVFYDDINGENPVPNTKPESITFELIPETAGIVKEVEIGEAVDDNSRDNYGWRPISFAIASPDEARARTQTLRIKCKTNPNDANENPLYRDVVISLLPTQDMRVTCSSPRVLLEKGAEQRVDVAIPDGLVESMFPLYFIIEASKLTLTPDTRQENLPVISETSIIGDYPSFHFRRTLTWDEYCNLSAKLDYEDESLWRTFSSHFYTNCEASATEIHVANEYFHTESTSFTNYESFKDPHFTTSIPCRVGSAVDVEANLMSSNQSFENVYLQLKGLAPADGSGIETDPATGEYYYTPTDLKMTFNLKTTVDDGDVSVTLYSKTLPYEQAVLTPWHFQDLKFLDMATPDNNTHSGNNHANIAYGHVNSVENKNVLVGYFTDPGSPTPKVTVSGMSGIQTSSTTWNDGGNISATARDRYREKWFQTLKGQDPVSVTFSAVGYVEQTISAPRFIGTIYTFDVNGDTSWNNFISSGNQINNKSTPLISMSISHPEDKAITKHDEARGITLPADGHYEMEVNVDTGNSDTYLFYAQVFYYVVDNVPLKPRSVEPEPDGSLYYGYLGNNKEYVWNVPFGATGGNLVMDAPSGSDIVITRVIMKAFHGFFNDSGNATGGDFGFEGGLNNGGNL